MEIDPLARHPTQRSIYVCCIAKDLQCLVTNIRKHHHEYLSASSKEIRTDSFALHRPIIVMLVLVVVSLYIAIDKHCPRVTLYLHRWKPVLFQPTPATQSRK